jgi:hypothetical protein
METDDLPVFLVAGGDSDPNGRAILRCLSRRRIAHRALLVGQAGTPRLSWDMDADVLQLDAEIILPRAVFVRHDVFTALAQNRPEPAFCAAAWFTTIDGWARAHADTAMLNRRIAFHALSKPYVLSLARQFGLAVPRTLVSNDQGRVRQETSQRALIAKPVNGGDYARLIQDVLPAAEARSGAFAAPCIIQECLVPPEIRVYGIGDVFLAFRISAPALDYRSTPACVIEVEPLERLAPALLFGLRRLMDALGLDFGAADFKAHTSGDLTFLEINSSPMFSAFDAIADGALSDAIVDQLLKASGTVHPATESVPAPELSSAVVNSGL